MRKLIGLLICFSILLGLIGCGTPAVVDKEQEFEAFSYVWQATDTDVTHETGNYSVDSGWGSVAETESGSLCSASVDMLHATAYTMAARLLTDEDGSSKSVVAVLRVLDAEGNELGRHNVRVCDFAQKLHYQDFVFTFSVKERTAATVEIYWPGVNYVRVSQFAIMSRNIDKAPDASLTGKAILGVDIEEDIAYDEDTMYYFDLNSYMQAMDDAEQAYDIANLICTLQGLVNRDGQRLYVRFVEQNTFCADTDNYWLDYLTADGEWLAGKNIVEVKSPTTLLEMFADYYNGFAAWDPAVPATVNAVATACGVDDLLPVRYSTVENSLYWYINNAEAFFDKPVVIDLGGKFTGEGLIYGTERETTGSRKNDVYVWAKETYLDTRKTNSHMMAYHVDAYAADTVFAAYADLQNMFLSNRDYYIANRAFFFDLSVMEFEIPDDDPDQADIDRNFGTIDYKTFTEIMLSQSSYAAEVDPATPIDVGGFTPWHLKYTRYTNPDASGEVACEWETVYQFSIYNAYVNADAPGYTAMANASIFTKYPASESYTQVVDKSVKETLPTAGERGANYLMFYVGDFDASAWFNTAMISFWADPNRGKIPLCWSFALNITKRAPHVAEMMYATATANDYFVAGDNGVGYLNPQGYNNKLSADVYGDHDSWAAYNKTVFERFDIDYQGFLITTKKPGDQIIECYKKFTQGVATNHTYTGDVDFPVTTSMDYSNVENLLAASNKMEVGSRSTFKQLRFILRSPTDLVNIYNIITSDTYKEYNFKVVDPYTFYGLLAQQNAAQ